MAWKSYICEIGERISSVLVDQRFENEFPLKELPNLYSLAVYFNLFSNDSFWHSDETPALEDIENNLLKLAESFGNGWIVYVIRIDTIGVREYNFYYGKQAEIDKIVILLKSLHPSYRIESDTKEDAEWSEYKNYVSFETNSGLIH